MGLYKVLWFNEHASGVLPFTLDTEAEAEQAGKDWLFEMCGLESPPLVPEDEYCPYSYVILKPEAS